MHADQLAHLDAIERHGKIFREKVRRVFVVGENAADATGRHDHDVGTDAREVTLGLVLPGKIKLAAFCNEHVIRVLSQTPCNCRTCHPGMAGDKDALARKVGTGDRELRVAADIKALSLLRLALELDVANRWGASAPATSASGTLHNRDRG